VMYSTASLPQKKLEENQGTTSKRRCTRETTVKMEVLTIRDAPISTTIGRLPITAKLQKPDVLTF